MDNAFYRMSALLVAHLLAESDEGKGTAEGATGSQSHLALVVECFMRCSIPTFLSFEFLLK
jgi:hypothetical protein